MIVCSNDGHMLSLTFLTSGQIYFLIKLTASICKIAEFLKTVEVVCLIWDIGLSNIDLDIVKFYINAI